MGDIILINSLPDIGPHERTKLSCAKCQTVVIVRGFASELLFERQRFTERHTAGLCRTVARKRRVKR